MKLAPAHFFLYLGLTLAATASSDVPNYSTYSSFTDKEVHSNDGLIRKRNLIGDSFRLKLYWEKGYEWQGKTTEKKWCMEVDGKHVEIQDCSSSNNKQRWKSEGKTIRTSDGSSCLTKVGSRYVEIKKCDGSKSQRWEGFRSSGAPFELYPEGQNDMLCVTQHHHPKKGEKLYLYTCRSARNADTSKWNVY